MISETVPELIKGTGTLSETEEEKPKIPKPEETHLTHGSNEKDKTVLGMVTETDTRETTE